MRIYSPLEEFNIYNIIRNYNKLYDITISNMTIYILINILIVLFIIYRNRRIKNNKWNILIKIIYIKLEEMNKDFLRFTKYIPFIFYIFIFILFNNLIGIIPYSFTTTSHFIITVTMSLSIIIGITIIGFYKHSLKFFNLFIPSGLTIKAIIPLIFIIELISYLSRIVSLSVRLSTNMISGHILLHLISSFGILLPLIFSFIPILALFPFFILEIGVCIIQAYVFTLLTIAYIKDIYYIH
jgi:ATP synthase subunit 6